MGLLDGTVALVTGGGRGIGRAVVDRFVAEGARVGVLDRSAADANALAATHGAAVVVHVGDVRSRDDNAAVVEKTVAAFGRLDTLVPNAGVYDFSRPFEATSAEDLDRQFDELFSINVKGYLLAVAAALPHLRRAEGSIVFTLSSSSFHAGGGGVLYVSAKHALVGTLRQLAFELAPEIRVNGVAPGGTRTDLAGLESAGSDGVVLKDVPGLTETIARALPLGFVAEPEDHAGLYVALASPRISRFVTATIVRSDGGVEVRGGGRRRRPTAPAEAGTRSEDHR